MEFEIIKNDPWLEPYRPIIEQRYNNAAKKELNLTGGDKSLADFAVGYQYFGLHQNADASWTLREWAPNATKIYLIGELNSWNEDEKYSLTKLDNGVWEITLSATELKHTDLYRLSIHWDGGKGDRIPAWATRVVQDPETYMFSAQVWKPKTPYRFKKRKFTPKKDHLYIYECHIGMAQEAESVGTYNQFREDILPRIAANGYNAIQIMAIQEHPYYGSFGYHVSSFFAASSRFGTPEELKLLIDTAHQMGIAVIMDIVHSHAVKNEVEGLGNYDGDPSQFFYKGAQREHPAWDSLCFDYGKNEVLHFLLSNCQYWQQEYKFDGFRFDGVTSMLYYDHGLEKQFSSYDDYFNGAQDENAITYLTLANRLIHQVNPNAITIAEDMSGMPGIAASSEAGGLGFDYRMSMGTPDFWIKSIKELRDEDWKPSAIFWELTNFRRDEKIVSYAESHDQALVGDKTLIFRLIDDKMYWHMGADDNNLQVERGVALHKIVRLLTASTNGGAYLNFMGNEFGHPEWIDFPREGNDWSYQYARRQWNLVDREDLKYKFLNNFDRDMLSTLSSVRNLSQSEIVNVWQNDSDQVLAIMRKDLLFVVNLNPTKSYTGYGLLVPKGNYKVVLDSDSPQYGGAGLINDEVIYSTIPDALYKKEKKEWVKLYLPARTALVLKKIKR